MIHVGFVLLATITMALLRNFGKQVDQAALVLIGILLPVYLVSLQRRRSDS